MLSGDDRPALPHKRASGLLGPHMGESEQQIAAAFAEARDTGTFLVLDEADSLLGDCRGVRQSWEVSQVNEMLTWMECHPLPFAATTNLECLTQPPKRPASGHSARLC